MPKWLKNIKDVTDSTECCETTATDPGFMNGKQRIAFGTAKNFLDYCTGNDGQSGKEQLLLDITGAAATGNFFSLNVIRGYAKSSKKLPPSFLLSAAPSGTAAVLIGGETLHGLLRLTLFFFKKP